MKKYVYTYYLDTDYIMTSAKKNDVGEIEYHGRVDLFGKDKLGNVLYTHTWSEEEFSEYSRYLHESIKIRVVSKKDKL